MACGIPSSKPRSQGLNFDQPNCPLFFFNVPLYHYRGLRISKFLWITFRSTDETEGPLLTCGQLSIRASSEENTRQNMDKGH